MQTLLPTGFADLLADATPATLILTTLRRDGTPVVSPVWFVAEPDCLLVVMEATALKAKHIRNDPRVAAVILAPHNHNRYLQLYGQATEHTDHDVQAIYRRLLRKYEQREPTEPTSLQLVAIVPTTMRGFDYNESADA
jgi:PPOX class probable F420-dependent enzyme